MMLKLLKLLLHAFFNSELGSPASQFPGVFVENEGQTKQPGFSVLELIMVMAISAIIMTSLLEIYNQVARNMHRVERFVFEDTQILTLKNRLGKDLSGLSAIWFTQAEVEAKQAEISEKKPTEQDKKKSSNYFYAINKDGHLDTLTFVTTAALQSYGTVSQFVRVVYQVEADPKHENMYRLMRKEISSPTENIDESVLKQGKFYELVSGVKSIEMIYQLIDKVELQKQQQAKVDKQASASTDKEEKKPIIRSVKQWGVQKAKSSSAKATADKGANEDSEDEKEDESTEKEEKQDLGGAAIPKFVEMKVVFGVTDKQVEKEYKLEFCIPATVDNIPQGMLSIKKPKAVADKPAEVGSGKQEPKGEDSQEVKS